MNTHSTNRISSSPPPPPPPAEAPRKKPVQEVRLGMIKAAIWENLVGDQVRHNVTFTRIYKTDNDWKNSDSFGRDDLLVLAKVADQAHTWICTAARAEKDLVR